MGGNLKRKLIDILCLAVRKKQSDEASGNASYWTLQSAM